MKYSNFFSSRQALTDCKDIHKTYGIDMNDVFVTECDTHIAHALVTQTEALVLKWIMAKIDGSALKSKMEPQWLKIIESKGTSDMFHPAILAKISEVIKVS